MRSRDVPLDAEGVPSPEAMACLLLLLRDSVHTLVRRCLGMSSVRDHTFWLDTVVAGPFLRLIGVCRRALAVLSMDTAGLAALGFHFTAAGALFGEATKRGSLE